MSYHTDRTEYYTNFALAVQDVIILCKRYLEKNKEESLKQT